MNLRCIECGECFEREGEEEIINCPNCGAVNSMQEACEFVCLDCGEFWEGEKENCQVCGSLNIKKFYS